MADLGSDPSVMNGSARGPSQVPSGQSTSYEDQPGPLPQLRRQATTTFRRPSSVRSESSSRLSRPSLNPGISTDSLLLPRATEADEEHGLDEPSLWYSTPLLFAVVPAVSGVFFKSGSLFITDLALLLLAALYLNWCLVTPWVWYRSAQSVKLLEPRDKDDIQQEPREDDGDKAANAVTQDDKKEQTARPDSSLPEGGTAPATREALDELRLHEVAALALCFLGPLLGSYILHVIRSQLSTLGDQLVSNLHLTLFVLGAEIRPMRHAMKMAQARTLYLQRTVREDPYISTKDQDQDTLLHDLRGRLDDMESSFAQRLTEAEAESIPPSKQADNTEALKRLQSSTQTQIDALTRAVRRYEKRESTYTMQTEARLRELDTRLKEAVSLAAAAASYSQKPGVFLFVLDRVRAVFAVPVKMAYTTIMLPFQFANSFIVSMALRSGLVQARPRTKPSKTPLRSKTSQAMRPKAAKSTT